MGRGEFAPGQRPPGDIGYLVASRREIRVSMRSQNADSSSGVIRRADSLLARVFSTTLRASPRDNILSPPVRHGLLTLTEPARQMGAGPEDQAASAGRGASSSAT